MMLTLLDITKGYQDSGDTILEVKDYRGKIVPLVGWKDFTLAICPFPNPNSGADNLAYSLGTIIGTGTTGLVSFPTIAGIPIGNFFYDVIAKDAQNKKHTLFRGSYKVLPVITKFIEV
jgi:hypothetical protein